MSLKQLISAIGIAGVCLYMNSCKIDNDPIPVGDNPSQIADLPINKLYQSLREQSQSFAVNAGSSQTITGARGTIITFNPQSFKSGLGVVLTQGVVHIELTEALTPGQMIMNRVSTITDNSLLQSGGSINIVATMNGSPVYANNYKISFKQSSGSSQPMALFNGIVTVDGINAGAVTWSNDTSNTVSGTNPINGQGQDSVGGSYYMFDSCTNFDWINCDYFIALRILKLI